MARSKERRYGRTLIVSTAALVLVSGCGVLPADDDQETVLIGVDLPLTGDASALGSVYRNALELRVEQVNQQGLLRDRQLSLEVTDNRSDSDTAKANIQELASNPDVRAIITSGCEECAEEIAEIVNGAGVPTIALAASATFSEPVEERQYLFKVGPNAGHDASLLTAELLRAEVGTVALAATDDAYGAEGLAQMEVALAATDIEIVLTEKLVASEDGLRSSAERIAGYLPQSPALPELGLVSDFSTQEPGPDAVVVWASDPVANDFTEALHAAGYSGNLYLDAVAATDPFLTGASGAAYTNATMVFTETLVIDEVIATSPAKAARQTWFRDYTSRFGTYHAFSSFGADAIQLIVEAINQAGFTARDTLRDAFEGVRFDGLTGPLRMTPLNHSGLRSQALTTLVVRGDRWRLAG
ncbi:MAG TPA: ABC transporter substrate-binding protein [Natronosporangium sp.]|nr:ABC transporter substrate-binding protein [Natronosporangium sp.]